MFEKEYKSVGRKTSKQTENESEEQITEKDKRKLTRKQKALLVGGAIVAAYATYKFIDSGRVAVDIVWRGK